MQYCILYNLPKTLLKEPKEGKDATKDQTHHGTSSSHVSKPVIGVCITLSQPTHPSVIPSMLARQGPIEPAPRPNTNISHVPTTAAADAMPEDARYHML